MIRISLTFIGIFLLGIIIGYFIDAPEMTSPSSGQPTENSQAMQDDLYQQVLGEKDIEIAKLSTQNTDLEKQLDAVSLKLEGLQETLGDYQNASIAEKDMEDSALAEISPDTEESAEVSEEERAERDLRRQEFIDRIRDGMLDRWSDVWEKASPESQDRIAEIAEYQQELFDMRLNMRNASSDEEREELIQASESIRENLRNTLRTEQNAQLTSIASKYGITKAKDIQQFLADTQEQFQSPVFQTSVYRGRGGFGGSWGGRRSSGRRNGDRSGFR